LQNIQQSNGSGEETVGECDGGGEEAVAESAGPLPRGQQGEQSMVGV